ncbi:MAG: hypothetical protein ACKVVP_24995 [Chloroflexota bacterium]
MPGASILRRLLPLVLLLGLLLPAPPDGSAQVRGGATLTVLRGSVGVMQANGSPISPAPSGLSLGVGDQVSTLAASGAVITFFEGSEVELGSETAIVIREASGQGARTNITIESIVGSSIHKVVTLTDAGSTYRVESGGTVGLVRGTLFGHRVDPKGDVTVALAGCGMVPARSTQPCLEFPRSGLSMLPGQVRTATARGDILTDSFSLNASLFNVIADPVEPGNADSGTDNPGIRTGSRAAPQGESQQPDDKDRPSPSLTPIGTPVPGQTVLTANAPAGSTTLQVSSQSGFSVGDIITIGSSGNQEVGQISGFGSILLQSPTSRDHQTGEPVAKTGSATASPTAVSTPGSTPVPCNNVTNSGGVGVTTTVHGLGQTSGSFQFFRDAFGVPDRFEILYENNVILDTGSVSGAQTHTVAFGPGASTNITVRVTGPLGTAWTYTVNCPI